MISKVYLAYLCGDLLNVHYVNVSVLIKFSKKDQCFYLNYHKFSIKSYVLDVY